MSIDDRIRAGLAELGEEPSSEGVLAALVQRRAGARRGRLLRQGLAAGAAATAATAVAAALVLGGGGDGADRAGPGVTTTVPADASPSVTAMPDGLTTTITTTTSPTTTTLVDGAATTTTTVVSSPTTSMPGAPASTTVPPVVVAPPPSSSTTSTSTTSTTSTSTTLAPPTDVVAPTVSAQLSASQVYESGPAACAQRETVLRVFAKVVDDGRIVSVVAVVHRGATAMGEVSMTFADGGWHGAVGPWPKGTITSDLADLEVVVHATDAAGNVGRSDVLAAALITALAC